MRLRAHHPVERQVGYEALLLAERRRLHAAAASALEGRIGPARDPGSAPTEADDADLRQRIVFDTEDVPAHEAAYAELVEHWERAGRKARAGLCALALAQTLLHRGQYRPATAEAARALRLLDEAGDASGSVAALLVDARVAERVSEFERSRTSYDEASRRTEGAADAPGLRLASRVAAGLGNLHWRMARWNDALAVLERAVETARRASSPREESAAINNTGSVYFARGDYDTAARHYEQALAMRRAVADRRGEAGTLNNLAMVHWNQARLDEALAVGLESLALRRGMGDRWAEASGLNNAGLVFLDRGELAEAERFFRSALSLRRAIGDAWGETTATNNLGQVLIERDQIAEAEALFASSLELARRTGDPASTAQSLFNLGVAHREADRLHEALAALDEAIAFADARQLHHVLAPALAERSRVKTQLGDQAGAVDDAARAERASEAHGNTFAQISAAIARAAAGGDVPLARRARDHARAAGLRLLELDACLVLAEVHLARGERVHARDFATAATQIAEPAGALCALRRAAQLQARARA